MGQMTREPDYYEAKAITALEKSVEYKSGSTGRKELLFAAQVYATLAVAAVRNR